MKKNTQKIAARLHVLLAADSPQAVVIRRGPSLRTAVIGWDRNTDVFSLGQWIKDRIYQFRSDISPDGKHWIYCVRGRTCVARPPYLKALDMYEQNDAWNGGGLFVSNQEYWLNKSPFFFAEKFRSSGLAVAENWQGEQNWQGECPLIYFRRLQRDGWLMEPERSVHKKHHISPFSRRINDRWTLVKHFHAQSDPPKGRGIYHETHALRPANGGADLELFGWEWADIDGNRLIWAENGCIMSGHVDVHGLTEQKLLFDTNPLEFEERIAPYAAPSDLA